MSVKYIWWGHAKGMVRLYPIRKAQYEDIIDIGIVPANDGMPHGHNVSSPVEGALVAAEDKEAYREYWAVKQALDLLRQKSYGAKLMEFVRLYYWTQPRVRMERIASRLGVNPETIRKWNKTLLYQVGLNRGWLY